MPPVRRRREVPHSSTLDDLHTTNRALASRLRDAQAEVTRLRASLHVYESALASSSASAGIQPAYSGPSSSSACTTTPPDAFYQSAWAKSVQEANTLHQQLTSERKRHAEEIAALKRSGEEVVEAVLAREREKRVRVREALKDAETRAARFERDVDAGRAVGREMYDSVVRERAGRVEAERKVRMLEERLRRAARALDVDGV